MKIRSLVIVGCLCLVMPPPLVADSLALEEILVSARRVAESSQTVPISMSVLTREKMDSMNAFDFTEIDRIVPSLQLGANSPASATLKIRNVGPDFFALAFPAAVAVYVDDVPQAQPGTVFSTMLDIERIEVLNGPQGTLYGKNAPAGLISIHTVNPHMEGVDGYINSSYSSWETLNSTGAINIPLVKDTFALRVAAMYAQSDGYMDNAVPGVNESNGKEHKGVRTKFLWRPTQDMDVLLSYYYADLNTDDNGIAYEGQVPDDRDETNDQSSYNDYTVFKGVPSYSQTDIHDFNLNWSWSLDTVNMSLVAQYQDLNIFQQQDNSNYRVVPPPEIRRDFLQFDPTTYSVEFKIDGEVTDAITYVSGMIYSDDDTSTVNFIQNINIDGTAKTESWGIYSNWTYRFSDHWDSSVGVRYTDVDYTATVFGFLPEPLGGLDTAFDDTYSDPSYSFKLRYYPMEDVLAYFAVDTAFRSGGINALAPLAGKLAEDPVVGAVFPTHVLDNLQIIFDNYFEFGQEDTIAYEVGMKGTFFEQRFRWNIAAFIQYYDDHQYRTSPSESAVSSLLVDPFSNLNVNVEELEVYGFETEVDYLVDENWSVFATAAYAKPEIQKFSKRMCNEGEAAPATLVCPGESGDQLNDEPQLHLLSQLRYQRPLSGTNLEFFSVATMEYYDEPYQRVSTPNLEDILTFDLSVGIQDVRREWSVKVWSKNITDETVLFEETLEQDTRGADPIFEGYSSTPGAPRSFGITGDYRF